MSRDGILLLMGIANERMQHACNRDLSLQQQNRGKPILSHGNLTNQTIKGHIKQLQRKISTVGDTCRKFRFALDKISFKQEGHPWFSTLFFLSLMSFTNNQCLNRNARFLQISLMYVFKLNRKQLFIPAFVTLPCLISFLGLIFPLH